MAHHTVQQVLEDLEKLLDKSIDVPGIASWDDDMFILCLN